MEKLQLFCQHWQIRELAVFGSILREDFRTEDSDVDFLAVFDPASRWSLLDRVRMESDLEALLQRKVDLLDREEVELSPNWLRRRAILQSARVIYAAG
jgi:predicted nucleotidyltransferase